jgi:LEA14-like dessication related protein
VTLEKNAETSVIVSMKIDTLKASDFLGEYIRRKEKGTIVIEGKISFDLTATEYVYSFTYTMPFDMKPDVRSVTHRWGQVTPDTSEVITTIIVYNPIPAPIPVKNFSADITMQL